jgi:hypothetical protein
MELKHPDIVSTLFAKPDLDARIEVLVTLLMDLFVEVEALRESVIRLDGVIPGARPVTGIEIDYSGLVFPCRKSIYQKAYLETAYETHNNGGPSGGLDKLLARFYPPAADDMGRTWRECVLLDRLGFSQPEIAAYKRAAEEAEMLT